jgi:hypothetical protein
MGSAFIVALAIAIAVYNLAGPSHRLGMALRATARWSFLWFCLATYGGALTTLFGAPFLALARRGRDLGLAFVAAHSVHILLAAWQLYVSPDPFPRVALIVFSVGVFWTAVLAVLSLSSQLSQWLGPQRWKAVRALGVEYIAFAFAFEFGGRILGGNRANAVHYLPLFLAAVGGPLLRIGASIKRRRNAHYSVGLSSG